MKTAAVGLCKTMQDRGQKNSMCTGRLRYLILPITDTTCNSCCTSVPPSPGFWRADIYPMPSLGSNGCIADIPGKSASESLPTKVSHVQKIASDKATHLFLCNTRKTRSEAQPLSPTLQHLMMEAMAEPRAREPLISSHSHCPPSQG